MRVWVSERGLMAAANTCDFIQLADGYGHVATLLLLAELQPAPLREDAHVGLEDFGQRCRQLFHLQANEHARQALDDVDFDVACPLLLRGTGSLRCGDVVEADEERQQRVDVVDKMVPTKVKEMVDAGG